MEDERNTERLLKVAPFPCEAALSQVVTVVAGIDNHGIVGYPLRLEFVQDAVNHKVYAANHSEVRLHILLIFFRCIPGPEITLAVHGLPEEFGQVLKDGGVVQPRGGNLYILIHVLNGVDDGEMAFLSGSLVTIFSMHRAKAHRETERLLGAAALQEIDGPFDIDFVNMTAITPV